MQEILNYFKKIPDKHINVFSFLLIITSLLFLFSSFKFISIIFIAVFAANILFWLEGRFSFGFALLFLICTMIAVAIKEDVWAENFAILVYYLLLSGVFIDLMQMGVEKINEKYTLKEFFVGYKKIIFKKIGLGKKTKDITEIKTKSKFVNSILELSKYRIKIYKIEDK